MATTEAAVHNAQYKHADIPLDLIDEPEHPERETMDEQELAELALSIREVGLVEPLVVKRVGDRFEVIAGHRRLLGCRMVAYTPVPCRVRDDGNIDHLAILIAENAHREDPNPIEEARFYQRILDAKAGGDVDKLCEIVRRNRDFVEGRLLLLMGYPQVTEALAQRRITIAVARGLNKCADANRLLILLDTAINSGATARQVAEWVRDANGLPPIELPADDANTAAGNGAAGATNCGMVCCFCGGAKHPHVMRIIWVHETCLDQLTQLTPAGDIYSGA